MPIERFVDPYTGKTLKKDSEGNLYYKTGDFHVLYKSHNGCYDFVKADQETQEEKEYYDKVYAEKLIEKMTPDSIRNEWSDEMAPWRQTLLESLGDITGKHVLLLGNGETSRELFFQQLGANVVLSDLSIEAVKHKKKEFELAELDKTGSGSMEFHAVDALHLPFPNESFDIIYGAAFVHHLDDLGRFFKEVNRCLKTNGICRFIDQAHSPVWRFMSQTLLRPLKMYSYWRHPRSAGDLRADLKGGYTQDALLTLMQKHGFKDLVFIREWFLFRIVSRHYNKLVRYNPTAMRRAKSLFKLLKWIDTCFMNSNFMKRNGLMLVWGFKK